MQNYFVHFAVFLQQLYKERLVFKLCKQIHLNYRHPEQRSQLELHPVWRFFFGLFHGWRMDNKFVELNNEIVYHSKSFEIKTFFFKLYLFKKNYFQSSNYKKRNPLSCNCECLSTVKYINNILELLTFIPIPIFIPSWFRQKIR